MYYSIDPRKISIIDGREKRKVKMMNGMGKKRKIEEKEKEKRRETVQCGANRLIGLNS